MTRNTAASPTTSLRWRRRTWLIVGGVVTAVTLLLTSSTVWTWLARLSAETETGGGSYIRPVSLVVVDADEVDLVLMAGQAGRVRFERRLEWSGSKPTVEETWDGQTFQVTARCPDGPPLVVGADPVCSVGYTIAVPAEVAVDVTSRSGEIEVRDLGGEVRLSESTGSVTVDNIIGPLALRTTTGDIVGSGLRSSHVEVRVDTGNVDLSFATPPEQVIVVATTGNPTIEVPGDDRYRVSVETSTGNQDISVVRDPDATRTIDIRTTSGDVRIRYVSQVVD